MSAVRALVTIAPSTRARQTRATTLEDAPDKAGT